MRGPSAVEAQRSLPEHVDHSGGEEASVATGLGDGREQVDRGGGEDQHAQRQQDQLHVSRGTLANRPVDRAGPARLLASRGV